MVLDFSPLFILSYWGDGLEVPSKEKRPDLPKEYRKYDHVLTYALMEMFCDESPKQLYCTSRKRFKTGKIEAYIIQKCVTYTGDRMVEALFFAPRENHLMPVLNRVKSKVLRTPLFEMMLESWNASDGIVKWRNNVTLHTRIEGQQGGENMIGLRAELFCVGDEMAYGSQAAEDERKNTLVPGCPVIYAGVPNGWRNSYFYTLDQTTHGNSWSRHRGTILDNPIYHSKWAMKEELAKHKDGIESHSWRTQVKGEWGDESYQSFPVIGTARHYSERAMITARMWASQPIGALVKIPTVDASEYIIHGDIGYAPSPTELGISALIGSTWTLIARYTLFQISMPEQARLINAINREILPIPASLIGIDAHGQGSGVLQTLHSDGIPEINDWAYDYKSRAFDVGFAGSMEDVNIWICKECNRVVRIDRDAFYCDFCKKTIYSTTRLKHPRVQTKQRLTQELKEMLVTGVTRIFDGEVMQTQGPREAIVFFRDPDLIAELEGTTEQQASDGVSVRYIPPNGVQHITDCVRTMVATILRREATEISDSVDDWLEIAGFF
ncbi:hypothetical protein Rctr71_006 [Virus Rctr71]|nr:hypothetical protein Rctr71_006 [Virus Rctr71]